MFQTSVFPVPPGAERKVMLRYNQLLRKDHRLTDFLFPLSTAKYTSRPVEKVSIQISIESTTKIKSVYSPTHSVEVKRPDDRHAVVKYEAKHQTPADDFRLFYDVAKEKLGASVVSYRPESEEDGYFLLLASPEIKAKSSERVKKTAIIVVDRSGSMSGKKIEQAKEALKFVLNNLRDGDVFNIVAYDSAVESFRPELQRYNEETRKAAIGFVESIYAGGSTNIDEALRTAVGMIQDSSRPSYIIFLTDGRPTAGETNESKIAASVRKANERKTRLITLGVGYDVNSRLLDRLSRDNFGQTEYARPDEDLEVHVSRLYNRISSPVMTDVTVQFELDEMRVEEGPAVSRVYPREVHDLFAGEQLVLVGRYKKSGQAKVTIRGRVGKDKQKVDFPAKLVKHSADQSYAFVEKLWAMRRIGEIIEELDLHGKNDELVNELVALSTKHGILTPYTSFLADENAREELADAGRARSRADVALRRLGEAEGRAAFAQRAAKSALQRARRPTSDSFGYFGADRAAGGMGGMGYAGRRGAIYLDIDSDEVEVAESVLSIGNQTLYKRGKLWIAANAKGVDLSKDEHKIKVIERFSEEYFKLVRGNTPAENAILAYQRPDEELVIKLRGQLYRVK
jgi:Ca-activated chloride channel family protein